VYCRENPPIPEFITKIAMEKNYTKPTINSINAEKGPILASQNLLLVTGSSKQIISGT